MIEIEMTAKTSEEAIEIALKELDVEREEVEINVVSKGKAGILGIGSEPAKVHVKVLEKRTELVTIVNRVLEDLFSKMGVTVVVNLKNACHEDIGGPVFDVDGEDSGLLIGRRGETLRALQFMVRLIVSRELGEKAPMLLDVSGYQERRYKSLSDLAHRVADRVVSAGRSISLEPMPPNERRAIHVALADRSGVNTNSVGEGEGRQVVVEPSN